MIDYQKIAAGVIAYLIVGICFAALICRKDKYLNRVDIFSFLGIVFFWPFVMALRAMDTL